MHATLSVRWIEYICSYKVVESHCVMLMFILHVWRDEKRIISDFVGRTLVDRTIELHHKMCVAGVIFIIKFITHTFDSFCVHIFHTLCDRKTTCNQYYIYFHRLYFPQSYTHKIKKKCQAPVDFQPFTTRSGCFQIRILRYTKFACSLTFLSFFMCMP